MLLLYRYLSSARKLIFLCWAFFIASFVGSAQDSVYREFLYPDGTISSKGFLLNGQPDGLWQSFYPDGKRKSEGWRTAGKLDSVWRFYDEGGYPQSEINYLAGLKNGYYRTFATVSDLDFSYLVSKELYVNDLREGVSYYYSFPGYLSESVEYAKNKKHGTAFFFDSTGIITAYAQYINGLLMSHQIVNKRDSLGNKTGIWKEFHPNGSAKSERVYETGRIAGYVKEYDRNGQVISAQLFHNDSLIVDSLRNFSFEDPVEYLLEYPNGTPRHRGAYRDSIPIGTHRFYDTTGAVRSSFVYSYDGIKLSEGILADDGTEQGLWKYFYSDAKVSKTGYYRNGKQSGKWYFYYPSGILQNEGSFVSGRYSGIWKFYSQSGSLIRALEYSSGKENGQCTEYDDSARVIASGMYIDGFREGLWTIYTGEQYQSGSYRMGDRHGVWQYFYLPDSVLRFSGVFKLGLADGKHSYFYADGSKEREEWWRSGKRIKVWKYYRYQSNLEFMVFYKNGKESRTLYIEADR